MKLTRSINIKYTILYIILVGLAFFYLFPIYTLINTSLKTTQDLIWGPVTPTKYLYFGAYQEALNRIHKPLVNSIIITVFATVISSFLGAMSGYVFSKFSFRGLTTLFFMIIIGFYIAPQSILIPLVRFIGKIGLYGTCLGLILTHVAYGMPITTLLFRNYYESIPGELVESAQIDGCGVSGIFTRIILPLSLPGFALVAIFQFTNIWNEFLFGLILSRGIAAQPVTVAVANLKGTTLAAWNVQMAGAFIVVIPVMLVYIFLLKLIVKGLLLGSIKG